MQTNLVLEVSISVNAPKSKVWQALVDPEQIKKYFFGTHTQSTWEVGSPITFSGEWEGKPYLDKGTILEFEPEIVMKYNYWSSFSGTEDVPANYANITHAVEEKDGKTILTITQDGIKSEEALEHSKQNWNMVLKSMKEMLEQ